MVWTECLCSPKFLCGRPNPQYYGIWKWGLEEVIKVRLGDKDEALMMELIPLKMRKRSLTPPCGNTVKQWLSASREDSSPQELNLPTPSSWTS